MQLSPRFVEYGLIALDYLPALIASIFVTLYIYEREKNKAKTCVYKVEPPEEPPRPQALPGELVPRDSVMAQVVRTDTGYALGYLYHYPAKFESLAVVVENEALNLFNSVDFMYAGDPMPVGQMNTIQNVPMRTSAGSGRLTVVRVPKHRMTYEDEALQKITFAMFFLHLEFREIPEEPESRKRERLNTLVERILRNSSPTTNKVVYHQYEPEKQFLWTDYDATA